MDLLILSVHKISLPIPSSFESISGKLEYGQSCLNILNTWSYYHFSALHDILSYTASLPHDLVLMGDFKLNIDSSSSSVRKLTDMLESSGHFPYPPSRSFSRSYPNQNAKFSQYQLLVRYLATFCC